MKNFVIIIILNFMISHAAFNQIEEFTCYGGIESGSKKSSGPITDYLNYIPNSGTPIRYIRLNFHFMLLEDSHPDAPGNFTPFDDGIGNPDFTAYDFIEDWMRIANQRLDGNIQMTYPLGNSTPVIARKYRFTLNGIFFHKDNTYFWFGTDPESVYSKNPDNAVNVFLQSDGTPFGGGDANMDGDRYVHFKARWDFYDQCKDLGRVWDNWANAFGLMHETGHSLSLKHTILTSLGACCNLCDDYCTDTPTRQYVINHDLIDPCCSFQWNCPQNSNNVMEYQGEVAVTPEQLGRVHATIVNEIPQYQPCYYQTSNVSITNFTDNKAYIGEIVTVPSASNIIIDNCEALYINADQINIYGPFEVSSGGQLVINQVPKCN
jgi:hypothetical protein